MIILIPLPLFFSSTVYSVGGLSGKSSDCCGPDVSLTARDFLFVAWVVVGMIWTFCSAFIVVLYPLWESRVALTQITTGIVKVRGFPSLSFCLLFTCCMMYRTSFLLEAESSRGP